MTTAELEIALHRRDAESYYVDLRFHQPGSDADVRPAYRDLRPLRFDAAAFARAIDPAAYGRELAQRLFTEANVATAFAAARAVAASNNAALRVRLSIGPSALELHNLHWETLLDPATDPALATPLLTNETIVFSRYLSSPDLRPVRVRPKRDLTALVVVAAPSDSAQWGLAAIDVAQELATARAGLAGVACTEVTAPGTATLANMLHHLRDEFDLLYLVAHGKLQENGEPLLYVENDEADKAGKAKALPGSELVTRLQELAVLPRLIVLASCQSAGAGNSELTAQDQGALAALGPRLAEAGVPAVLAMQGNISMATVQQFMPIFFAELQRDGQIDRALAVARSAVRTRPDWWMPVLFMRLKSGRIWYVPGFGDDSQGLKQWPALLRTIERKKCTPILGPGLGDSLLGSRREIARRWAETYRFPLEAYRQEDLPQVAQFLAVNQSLFFLQDELENYLRQELWQHMGAGLDPALQDAPLATLLTTVSALLQKQAKPTIYQALAGLDLPIYITTNPDNLLFDALAAQGKKPLYEFCRWNDAGNRLPLRYEEATAPPPSPQQPLIYHLFGHLSEPDTLVLTEDDYFDYLIGVTRNNGLIPSEVRRALADTALLFLGFRLDDWDFRVLFRSIMQREGSNRRNLYPHIAAQLNPDEERIVEPASARQYLEARFQHTDINIFWGSVEDFRQALLERRK